MVNAQEIIDSVQKIKRPKKKIKNESELESSYVKDFCLKELKENPNITSFEIANKLGILKEQVEKIIENNKKENIVLQEKEEPKVKVKKESFFKKFLKNNKLKLDDSDKSTILDVIAKVIILGLALNFSLFVIFNIKFNFYSWIGWGIALWFVEKKFVDIIRGMWIK